MPFEKYYVDIKNIRNFIFFKVKKKVRTVKHFLILKENRLRCRNYDQLLLMHSNQYPILWT